VGYETERTEGVSGKRGPGMIERLEKARIKDGGAISSNNGVRTSMAEKNSPSLDRFKIVRIVSNRQESKTLRVIRRRNIFHIRPLLSKFPTHLTLIMMKIELELKALKP